MSTFRPRTFAVRVDGIWYSTYESTCVAVADGVQLRQMRADGRPFFFSTTTVMQAGRAVPCGVFTPLSYAEARAWCAKHRVPDLMPASYKMEEVT